MARSSAHDSVLAKRDERVEELMQQLRPKIAQALRRMVERAGIRQDGR